MYLGGKVKGSLKAAEEVLNKVKKEKKKGD